MPAHKRRQKKRIGATAADLTPADMRAWFAALAAGEHISIEVGQPSPPGPPAKGEQIARQRPYRKPSRRRQAGAA